MNEPIISTKDLYFRYDDGTEALKGITISFPKGKKIALLGNNGAGKSTLFLHLNGVYKPASGTVFFKGNPIQYSTRSLKQLRKSIGIVFQNPDEQLFSPTVYEDVAYGPRNLGLSNEEIINTVHQAMERTGILEIRGRPTHFLSLGQKKRVAIAGILAMNPDMIILDEPTAGLDSYYAKKIIQVLNLIHDEGKTIVLSTHDMNLAYEWADEIIVMNDGKIIASGLPESVFQNEELLKKSNLEKPFILQFYQHLIDNNCINRQGSAPRSKEDLFKILEKSIYSIKR